LVRQKGSLGNLPIPPKHPAVVRLPVRIPSATDEELFLGLHYHYRNTKSAGKAVVPGRTLAREQLLLKPWTGIPISVKPAGDLSFTDSNGLFTILSPTALLQFDKQTGWLQTYEIRSRRLAEDSPGLKSRFWLEPADPGYAADSAAVSSSWKEAGRAPHLQLFSTSTGSQLVIVKAEYTLPETSCLLHLSYTINAAGEMQVGQSMDADSTKQGESLPCFGMYWLLPAGFDSVAVYGSSATPFRETSGYATRTYSGVRWCTITGPDGKGLRFTADSTLLTINTRSSDPHLFIDNPSLPYHLPYGNYRYTYKVSPVLPEEKPTIKNK
jgi:beta-galactosidase